MSNYYEDYYSDDFAWNDQLPFSVNTEKFRKKHDIPGSVPDYLFTHGNLWNGLTIYNPIVKTDGRGGDAGIDLFCTESCTLPPHTAKLFDSFVVIYMMPGELGLLRPRGGDEFVILSGVIDSSYIGTIKVKILNPYQTPMEFHPGDSIGQMVIVLQAREYGKNLTVFPHDKMQEAAKKYWTLLQQYRGDKGRINNG